MILSDSQARERNGDAQKTVRERMGPPAFDLCIEMKSNRQMVLHEDVATAVDAILRNKKPSGKPIVIQGNRLVVRDSKARFTPRGGPGGPGRALENEIPDSKRGVGLIPNDGSPEAKLARAIQLHLRSGKTLLCSKVRTVFPCLTIPMSDRGGWVRRLLNQFSEYLEFSNHYIVLKPN